MWFDFIDILIRWQTNEILFIRNYLMKSIEMTLEIMTLDWFIEYLWAATQWRTSCAITHSGESWMYVDKNVRFVDLSIVNSYKFKIGGRLPRAHNSY